LGNFGMSDQLYLEPVELLAYNEKQIAGGKAFTIATRVGGGMIRDRCVHALLLCCQVERLWRNAI